MVDEKNRVVVTDDGEASQTIQRLQKEIQRCETDPEWKSALRRIPHNRKAAKGEGKRVNTIKSTLEAMLPGIYAKNPDASVIPAPKAGRTGEDYQNARKYADTMQIVLNHQVENAHLKRKAKNQTRAVQVSRMGWLKVAWQEEYETDPNMESRIHDAQEDLGKLRSLVDDLEEGQDTDDDYEAKIEELELHIQQLESQQEVLKAYGITIDNIDTMQMRIDPDVSSLNNYQEADWIAHYIDVDESYVKSKYNVPSERLEEVSKHQHRHETGDTDKESKKDLYRIWEMWHKRMNTVFTWLDGDKFFLLPPQNPQGLGERWFPFFGYAHHWEDGYKWPNSDVELLLKLDEEYNTTRNKQAQVRENSNAYIVIDKGAVSVDDAVEMQRVRDVDILPLDFGGQPVNSSMSHGLQPPYNPMLYDVGQIRQDIDLVVNVTDAAKGNVERTKTLGEAQLLQAHMTSRTNERTDELEGMLTEMYQYIAEIVNQKMTKEQVVMIAGPNAYWPEIDKKTLFQNVTVEIKGGSTQKPDTAVEPLCFLLLLPCVTSLNVLIGARD